MFESPQTVRLYPAYKPALNGVIYLQIEKRTKRYDLTQTQIHFYPYLYRRLITPSLTDTQYIVCYFLIYRFYQYIVCYCLVYLLFCIHNVCTDMLEVKICCLHLINK